MWISKHSQPIKQKGEKKMYNNAPKMVTLRNVEILWHNFAGRGTDKNAEGDRNFNIIIPDDMVDELRGKNVPVKTWTAQDGTVVNHAKIKVSFKREDKRPSIRLAVNGGAFRTIEEDDLYMIDTALNSGTISNIDIRFEPSYYTKNGGGYSLYLQNFRAVIEDPFEDDTPRIIEDGTDDDLPFDV